jgi:hypothetical protein
LKGDGIAVEAVKMQTRLFRRVSKDMLFKGIIAKL